MGKPNLKGKHPLCGKKMRGKRENKIRKRWSPKEGAQRGPRDVETPPRDPGIEKRMGK